MYECLWVASRTSRLGGFQNLPFSLLRFLSMTFVLQAHIPWTLPCLSKSLRAQVPNKLVPSISYIFSLVLNPLKAALFRNKCLHLKFASYARKCIFPYQFCPLTTNRAKYGSDESTLPDGVPPNYFYAPSTSNAILRMHLYQIHPEEYNTALLQQVSPEFQLIQYGS